MVSFDDKNENVAPCLFSSCIFKTNILLLPTSSLETVYGLDTMLSAEVSKRELLEDADIQSYLTFAPSSAIDGKANTSFRTPRCEVPCLFLLEILY